MSGRIIVLIHGGASSGRMYKDVIPLLEQEGYTCVAPDLPGHGTAASERPFTFEAACKTISTAIKRQISTSTSTTEKPQVMLVGISLGGQSVLAFLKSDPEAHELLASAIVSGASIHPPDDKAQWEMPRMPTEQDWLDIIMADVNKAGMENMSGLQDASFGFTFDLPHAKMIPPTLAVVGEFDTPMSRRDLPELVEKLKNGNPKSESFVMMGAWHNHSIDVPKQFARTIADWAQQTM